MSHRYNLTLDDATFEEIRQIAVKERMTVLYVLKTAIKLFLRVYKLREEGKSITFDGKEVELVF